MWSYHWCDHIMMWSYHWCDHIMMWSYHWCDHITDVIISLMCLYVIIPLIWSCHWDDHITSLKWPFHHYIFANIGAFPSVTNWLLEGEHNISDHINWLKAYDTTMLIWYIYISSPSGGAFGAILLFNCHISLAFSLLILWPSGKISYHPSMADMIQNLTLTGQQQQGHSDEL